MTFRLSVDRSGCLLVDVEGTGVLTEDHRRELRRGLWARPEV